MTDTLPLLQDESTRRARERLLDAALAVITGGEEPTMRAVARAAGVSERTIYRYFPARDDLMRAVLPEVAARCSAPKPDCADGLPDYARRLFSQFEQHEALISALVVSPWAQPFLAVSRPRHVDELTALLTAAHPEAAPVDLRQAALSLRLVLSGSGWVHLRGCGLDPAATLAHAHWQIARVRALFAPTPERP